jgi:hypothetical protein
VRPTPLHVWRAHSAAARRWPRPKVSVLAFWLVAIDFFVWMVVMSVVILKLINRDAERIRLLGA